jgi:hypothetical protein
MDQKFYHTERANTTLSTVFLFRTTSILLEEIRKKNPLVPKFSDFFNLNLDTDTGQSLSRINKMSEIMYCFKKNDDPYNYTNILLNTLTFPALYFIIIATTENSSAPPCISYYQGDKSTPGIKVFNKGVWDYVAGPIYRYQDGNYFQTWLNLNYNDATQELLTVQMKKPLAIKRDYLLIDLRSFKSALRETNACSISTIPNFFPLPLKTVKTIKDFALEIKGYCYQKNSEGVVISCEPSNKKASFRTFCSAANVVPYLMQEAARNKIPSKLASALSYNYVNINTNEKIKQSFEEAIRCFVFAS